MLQTRWTEAKVGKWLFLKTANLSRQASLATVLSLERSRRLQMAHRRGYAVITSQIEQRRCVPIESSHRIREPAGLVAYVDPQGEWLAEGQKKP